MKLLSQPWKFLQWTSLEVKNVKRRGRPEPTPFILPKIYGRDSLPIADSLIEDTHEARGIDLNFHENCALLPRNVVLRRGEDATLLPPSFLRGRMKQHGGLRRVSPEVDSYFLRDNNLLPPAIKIDEDIYFVETDHPGVFGHVLVEALPMLWGYSYVPKGTKVATSIKMTRNYVKLFGALGVSVDSIIQIDRPIIPRAAYFPALPFVRRTWVHPVFWLIFDRIATLKSQSSVSAPKRIYISRSQISERKLENEKQVEQFFESIGFVVIHTQNHPIEDQIAMFSGAEMIAGTGGSAMHNMVFSSDDVKILIIASAAWLHVADMLIAQKKGDLGYVFGEAFKVPNHTHKSNTAWSVDIEIVRKAAFEHFGLSPSITQYGVGIREAISPIL